MNKFYFPLNYKYSPKFMGIIEYKLLIPISIIVAILIFVFYLFKIDFFIGTGIIVAISLPSIVLLSAGINGQPSLPYIKAVLKFSKKQKLYLYNKNVN